MKADHAGMITGNQTYTAAHFSYFKSQEVHGYPVLAEKCGLLDGFLGIPRGQPQAVAAATDAQGEAVVFRHEFMALGGFGALESKNRKASHTGGHNKRLFMKSSPRFQVTVSVPR